MKKRTETPFSFPSSLATLPDESVAHLSTKNLFRGRREIIIEHRGENYRLRITSKGKLILTK